MALKHPQNKVNETDYHVIFKGKYTVTCSTYSKTTIFASILRFRSTKIDHLRTSFFGLDIHQQCVCGGGSTPVDHGTNSAAHTHSWIGREKGEDWGVNVKEKQGNEGRKGQIPNEFIITWCAALHIEKAQSSE